MENKDIYDLIIVGSGPAGLTAAIYGRRANLKILMLEANAPGGKMVKTAEIENWPGVKSTSGPELAFQMFEHAMELGTELKTGMVNRISHDEIKEVTLHNGDKYYAKAILIATGTLERKLNIPGEDKFTNRGVSYCAVCDGALFRDKVVTIIGGGNSALEESLYLTKFASKVNIIIRRDVFRADAKVIDEVEGNEKINIIRKHIPIEITGDNGVTGIVVENVDTKEQQTIPTDGIFPFIGLDPMTSFISELQITNEAGYVKVNQKMETDVAGIFAGGDVIDKDLRQVVTAANDGAIAAQNIIKYIDEHHKESNQA